MQIVDDVARLVQRLGLTDVVHELATRLLLDKINQRVQTIVGEAPTHYLAVLIAVLKQREDMAHLVVKRSI
jgi:hypothetical protein